MNNLQLKIILSMADKLTTPLRNAMKGSKELAAALGKTKNEARSLEKIQNQLAGFNNMRMDGGNLNKSIDEQNKKIQERLGKLSDLGVESRRLRAKIKAEEAALQGWQKNVVIFGKVGGDDYMKALEQMQKGKLNIASLNMELDKTVKETKKYGYEVNMARKEIGKLEEKKRGLAERLRETKKLLRENGVNTRQLANEEIRLSSKVKTTNERLEEQRKKMAQLSAAKASYQKTKELRGRLAGTGAGLVAGGTAVGATAVKPIIEFAKAENSATELKVSMMGAGGVVRKEFGAINALATKLGNKLPGTTSDLQNMMSTLIQQGMTAKAILGGLGESTAYLAVQMKMPYDQAALFASKLQDATGTAEKDMMGLMDVIQRSHYLGVDSDNMLQAYAKMSPALSIIKKKGLEASKALAPLVVMADQQGMAGEASGNAYRKVFQMAMNTKKVHEANSGALAKTGVTLNFTDGHGEFAGIDKMMSELAKLKGLNTETRLAALKKVFGDDAETLQVLTILIEKGKTGYAEVQKKMADQADIQKRVNAQLGTLTNLWDAATGTFTNTLVKFGESVSPEVKAIIEWIGNLSERLGSWSDRHPILSAGIMKTVAAISALMVGLGGLSLGIATILGPFALTKFVVTTLAIKSFPSLGGSISGVWSILSGLVKFLTLNPFGMLVLALGGAAYLIWDNWEWLKGKFTALIQYFEGYITRVKNLFTEMGEGAEAHAQKIASNPALASGYATGNYGPVISTNNYKPITMPKPTVNSSVVNATITVVQQPGQDGKAVAAEVKKQMEVAQRNASKQARSRLSDRD